MNMCWRRVGCKYDFFSSHFVFVIMSIGHYVARKREILVTSSSCLFAGTHLSWLGLRWASVVKLRLKRMECVLQGESFHVGSIKIARNGLLVVVEHARAYRADFLMSTGSKSGTTRHEHDHR